MAKITHSVLQDDRPVLPEWTRWAWASMTDRQYWKPIFNRLSDARNQIELLSLIENVRPAIYQNINPNYLLDKINEVSKYGLTIIPITRVNQSNGYTASSSAFDISQPWEYRAIITRIERANDILSIPNLEKNNDKLGEILGYPACCREFFLRTWQNGHVDTTWDQYAESGSADGPVEANMLWRWMNIRWVSHLPCSFQCQSTVEIGRKTREAMRKHGLVEEIKALNTILSWPVKWSGVNGIAEIVGPCVKVSTRTDWAPPSDKRFFERNGVYTKPSVDIWEHNGFSSYQGMIESHAPIISEISNIVPQNGAIIDLGCGNGRLLKMSKLHRPDIKIGGVDTNIDAINSAQSSLVGKWDASKIEELKWSEWFASEDTVLVYSPVRLTEMSSEDAIKVRQVMSQFKTHLVYIYNDNAQARNLNEWVSLSGYSPQHLIVFCSEEYKDVSVGMLHLE